MKVKCPNCEGLTWKPGQFGEKILCRLCTGTGFIESENIDLCTECQGRGFIKNDILGKETCPKCNGLGKIEQR